MTKITRKKEYSSSSNKTFFTKKQFGGSSKILVAATPSPGFFSESKIADMAADQEQKVRDDIEKRFDAILKDPNPKYNPTDKSILNSSIYLKYYNQINSFIVKILAIKEKYNKTKKKTSINLAELETLERDLAALSVKIKDDTSQEPDETKNFYNSNNKNKLIKSIYECRKEVLVSASSRLLKIIQQLLNKVKT